MSNTEAPALAAALAAFPRPVRLSITAALTADVSWDDDLREAYQAVCDHQRSGRVSSRVARVVGEALAAPLRARGCVLLVEPGCAFPA